MNFKNRYTGLLYLCSLFFLGAAPCYSVEQDSKQRNISSPKLLTNNLNKILENTTDISPGALLHVSGPGFEYSRSIGFAEKETQRLMDTAFRMRVGSITKTYLAALGVIAEKEQRLTLSDRIDKYLPNWAIETLPDNQVPTIQQLLQHTSGIPDYYDFWFYVVDWSADEPITPKLVLNKISGKSAVNLPGERFHYSNTNFHYLALILEAVYEVPLKKLLTLKLLQPLGLEQTAYNEQFVGGDSIHGYGAPIAPWGSPLFSWIDTYQWRENSGPDGGMFSDLQDLNRWFRAIYASDGAFHDIGIAMIDAPLKISERKYQGLGTEILVSKTGTRILGHTGSIDGYLTSAFYFEDSDFTMIFHMNYSDVEGFSSTTRQILATIVNATE